MYKIVDHLYLSSYNDADAHLKNCADENNIYVINCTANLPLLHSNGIRFAINDDKLESTLVMMKDNFETLVNIMRMIIERGNDVIVHCQAGQQRGPTIVAAYLMRIHSMSAKEAIAYIKTKKPDVFMLGINFWSSLKQYEKELAPVVWQGFPTIA